MKRILIALLLAGCSPPPSAPPTTIAMDYARPGSLWDAPFPSDDLARADGTIDLSKFPNPNKVGLIDQALALLSDARGFAQAGAIYFRASGPLDPTSLPDVAGSLGDGASVFVINIDGRDPNHKKFGQKIPVDVAFLPDGGPSGAKNMIALLPIQGLPLDPGTPYLAVVTTRVRDASGQPLARFTGALAVDPLRPQTSADADAALAMLSARAPFQIAGEAAFTTGTPTSQMATVRTAILARPPATVVTPKIDQTYPDYCVYRTTLQMPVYQSGMPPYSKSGGAWAFAGNGQPILDHMEPAGVVFTIPRKPAPQNGWPLVVFVRAGGGGEDPLVNRGPATTPDFSVPVIPGTGPAMGLAKAGFAAVQIDGPFEGIRNPTGGNEDFLIFNVFNPAALRDNIRQSAVELSLVARVIPPMQFNAADCPGAAMAHFDPSHLALMGHSMGAWIAPLALAVEPAYGAAVLSGAGGSYISNIMDKIKPTNIRPLAEIILNYDMDDFSLERHDPALTLIQWAAEPSDPQVYDGPIVGTEHKQVLMIQGIVDHYILPSIANATSLALGLDEAGPVYDAGNAEEAMLGQTALGTLLPLGGRAQITLPARGNIDAKTTAVVVQHPGDHIEDGHEVMFQTAAPKHQYRCFLSSWLTGTPVVPQDSGEDDPCP